MTNNNHGNNSNTAMQDKDKKQSGGHQSNPENSTHGKDKTNESTNKSDQK